MTRVAPNAFPNLMMRSTAHVVFTIVIAYILLVLKMCRQVLKFLRSMILIVVLLIFLMTLVIITNIGFLSDFLHFGTLDDISCYYTEDDGDLPAAELLNPSQNSIFFIETSCDSDLNSRQACSIESVARLHPNWTVYILFIAPLVKDTLHKGPIQKLNSTFDNIKVARIHLSQFLKSTVLEELVLDGYLYRSRWPISHTSDILRYLILYKWGGIYLDLDVVVLKSLDSLGPNWAARESNEKIASSALSLSKDVIGRTVSNATIYDLARNFRGDSWSHNGPALITRVLERRCGVHPSKMSAAFCDGFNVYGPNQFFPVRWQDWRFYFKPGHLDFPETYLHHVWNRNSYRESVPADSPYGKLARNFCPIIYYTYKDVF